MHKCKCKCKCKLFLSKFFVPKMSLIDSPTAHLPWGSSLCFKNEVNVCTPPCCVSDVWNDRLVYIQSVKQLYARNKNCKCLFTKLSGWWWWYWLPDGTMWNNICDTKWRERHACAPIIPRLAPFDWILIMIHSHNCVFIWYFNGSCCI